LRGGASGRARKRKVSRKTRADAPSTEHRKSARLDSLEKELRKTAHVHRKIAEQRPAGHSDSHRTNIEWRLSTLEGVLSAEQKARAQPSLRTTEIEPREREEDVPAPEPKFARTPDRNLERIPPTRPRDPPKDRVMVSFGTMSDRLATEVIRRQGLEERIGQLEDMIRSLVEKRENGAIDIIPAELEPDQQDPIQVRVPSVPVTKSDFTPQKVRSGTPRLDDLLLGGIPFGTNVLLYGPPFAGKELLMDAFIAEGVKWGTPILWLLTDRSPREIRNEMKEIFPEYEDAEKLGIIRYIDAHSRAVGGDANDPFTDYVESPTDFEAIQKLVEKAAKEFKKEHDYYRMAVRGLSTLIAYSDPRSVFRFLNSFVGKRKRDKAVTLYTISKGVHSDHDIQMLSSLMDGVIELKFENHETFMAIKGICDVRSRAYVRYSLSKTGMEIGSFSLDHIR